MVDAYRDDLAYIHDAGFGHLARGAAPVLLEALRRRGVKRGLVIDLGCGSGILSEQVSAAGYDVLGIDISEGMIALARQRVPAGRFRVESLLTAELPPCVALAAVGECLNYLFDSGNTERGLVRLLRRAYGALDPGGPFLLDVAGPGRVPGGGPYRSYFEKEDWAVLVTTEEDRQKCVLTRHITSFRKVGELYRRDHEVHRLRLFPRAEMAARLRAVGFRVRVLRGYGDSRFPPGLAGFLARKPG
jgi:SAM-dependent methyltransferase